METGTSTARVLDQVSSTLAVGVLLAAPVAFGSVHTTTLVLLSLLSLLAFAALLLSDAVRKRDGRGRSLQWDLLPLLFAALALWPAAQLIPLPPWLLESIAPETLAISADALSDEVGWRPISVDLPATSREFVRAMGLAALFATLRHHSGKPRFRRRLLLALACTGSLIAVSGFAHLLLGVDAFLGFWRPTAPSLLPLPFGNANHAAGILNASGLIALGVAASPKTQRPVPWTIGSLAAFAASATLGSRGGLIAGTIGLVVLITALAFSSRRSRDRQLRRRLARLVLPVFAATLVTGVVIATLVPDVWKAAVSAVSFDVLEDGKIVPVRAAVAMTKAQPWTGLGRGSFEVAHPRFLDAPAPVSFTHVENEPVQAVAELGIPIGLALIVCFGMALAVLAREARNKATEAGALAGTLALLIQGWGDFSLHFAGGFWLIALLSTPAGIRLPSLSPTPRARLVLAGAVGVIVLAIMPLALQDLRKATRALEEAVRDRSRGGEEVERLVASALRLRPADHVPLLLLASRNLHDDRPDLALDSANRALLLHPHSGMAHRLAGLAFFQLGRRNEALIQMRLAMERGTSTTRDVLRYFPNTEALLETTPTTLQASIDAAGVLLNSGRYEDGLAILGRVEGDDSDAFHYLRAVLAQRSGRLELAQESAQRLREIAPELPTGWILEAEVWIHRQQLDEAWEVLARGAETLGPNAWIELKQAWVALALGRVDEAWQLLDPLTPTSDRSQLAERHALRSTILRLRGDERRARKALARAVELAPSREDFHRQLQEFRESLDVLPSADLSDWLETLGR